jgi:hypothetical protein
LRRHGGVLRIDPQYRFDSLAAFAITHCLVYFIEAIELRETIKRELALPSPVSRNSANSASALFCAAINDRVTELIK